MDQKYPHHDAGEEDHDIEPERAWVRASVTPGSQVPAGSSPVIPPPPTGDDRVDAAAAELCRLPGTLPDDHVAVLERVHGRLRDILGELSHGRPDGSDEPAPGRDAQGAQEVRGMP